MEKDKYKKIHITALSDNHCDYTFEMPEIPDDAVSILIHAGDATYSDKPTEIQMFVDWLKEQPHDYKLWIPGNHSLACEDFPYNIEVIDNETGSTCIHNKEIKIEGIKFFGSAFTPEFNNWAYNHSEKQSKVFWDNAPDSDVVVCHGPPFMVLDSVSSHYPVERPLGCVSFKNYLERVKPKLAIFGHIHDKGYQKETVNWENGSSTNCFNVSVMDEAYKVVNPATVIKV